MKQVSKALADELLSLRREWWQRARAGKISKVCQENTFKSMGVERKMQEEANTNLIVFDDLANIVARCKFSNECYYDMLRACGFEVV